MTIPKQPEFFPSPLGENADVNTISESTDNSKGNASFNSLFPLITQVPLNAGGIAPSRLDFNGLFKLLGDDVWWRQHGGMYPYNPNFDYVQGNIVLYNNSLYLCLQANGVTTGNATTPSTNADVWAYIAGTESVSGIPVGTELAFAGSNIPEGYLLENGAAVSRTEYAALFNVIGTTWGEGDGSTTFNLPDRRGRYGYGADGLYTLGQYIEAGLPNITGAVSIYGFSYGNVGAYSRGALSPYSGGMGGTNYDGGYGNGGIILDASKSNSIYSDSVSTVQTNSLIFNYVIKC